MPKMETDFPRGGSGSHGTSYTPKLQQEQDLFKTPLDDNDETKKKKRKISMGTGASSAKKRKSDSAKSSVSKPEGLQIEPFMRKMVTPGMLVLGSVKEIHDYELVISLPNNLCGIVAISNIATSYTSQLQEFSENADDMMTSNDEMPSSLSELFKLGHVIPCKILDGEEEKRKYKLSINPDDVNQGLQAKHLRNGMVVGGAVSSREDHGYVVDLGLKGVRAFLSNPDAESFLSLYNEGKPLMIGQHLPCLLKDVDMTKHKRTVAVTVDPKQINHAQLKESMEVSFQSLLPGMKVNGSVTKTSDDGVTVKFLTYTGLIHRSHLMKPTSKYATEQKIQAVILYIEPTTKVVYLSSLSHLMSIPREEMFVGISGGEIVEEAKSKSVNRRFGVYFKIGENLTGFATISNLGDVKPNVDQILTKFKHGSVHRCRVMDFNYLDNVVIITLKESILKQEYLSYKDFHPGLKIKGSVLSVQERGVVVRVSNRIRGFVPSIQLAEVPLKHPAKKFPKDTVVKCRVLSVDPVASKLILTAKRSLVQSKSDVVSSYEGLRTNMLLQGFIANVKDTGVVVVFYNNVKGWVPLKELGDDTIPYPKKVFYPGQVVQCRVIHCNADLGTLILSLRVENRPSFGTKPVNLPDGYAVGKKADCTVVSKVDGGLNVQLMSSQGSAFIPKMHLSDYVELCEVLWDAYSEGDVIHSAIYLHHKTTVTLTMKQSFIQAAKEGTLVSELSNLKPGMMVPCSLRNRMDYGFFMDLANQLIGLAPNKFVSDHRLTDYTNLYVTGQSLVAKVTEVDQEKERFLLSLRMCDCYHDDVDISTEIVRNYLEQRDEAFKMLCKRTGEVGRLASLEVGGITKVTVTEVTEHGLLCTLEGDLKGFVTVDHTTGVQCKKGDTVEAVLLFVDTQSLCVELSLNPELIKSIKHLHKNKFTEAKEGQVLKCDVHLIKDDFILVSLRGHATGRLAYIPARRHLNDLQERRQFVIGQVNTIVIKRSDGCHIFGVLQMHDDKHPGREEKKMQMKKHELKLGSKVKAVIKAILDFQLNISIDGVAGRVHVSEMSDALEDKLSPMSGYKVDQEIDVKILGFREVKSHRYLPISHPNFTKALPECTLRPSKLNTNGYHEHELPDAKVPTEGDTVHGFVHSYSNHCLWLQITPAVRGKVYILNLSNDKKISSSPLQHYKIGTAYTGTVIGKVSDSVLEVSLIGQVASVAAGNVVRGFIEKVSPTLGAVVHLSHGFIGRVALTDMWDEYRDNPTKSLKENQVVQCYVVTCDGAKEKCVLSLRRSRTKGRGEVTDPEITSINDVKAGSLIKGYVQRCHNKGVFVNIGRSLTGHIEFSNLSDYFIKDLNTVFFTGKVVTAKVIRLDKNAEKVELSLLEKDTGHPENIPAELKVTRRQQNTSSTKSVKRKSENAEDKSNSVKASKLSKHVKEEGVKAKKTLTDRLKTKEEGDSGVEMNKDSDSEGENDAETDSKPRLQLSTGFNWDASLNVLSATPGGQSSSDESENEEEVAPVKISKKDIQEDEKEEERKLYKKERRYLEKDMEPVTADDFDRLVMQSPDSSMVWLRYMTFHLEIAELEKSRAVAERALRTISFREEGEKFNIWIAYMNLENMYGSPESLKAVFDRAVQQMEPLKVYQQLVNIYVESEKIEQAEQLYNTMLKKFRQCREVWIQFGKFLFQQTRAESARHLMQRSLKSLEKKEHIDVIIKFAQLEFKFGEAERGKTMFDNVLSNYAKRIDLWSVYIDLVVKAGEISVARQLFERVINIGLNEKKMKVIFKKYMDFEEKHGDEETANIVKQKAIRYVESRT